MHLKRKQATIIAVIPVVAIIAVILLTGNGTPLVVGPNTNRPTPPPGIERGDIFLSLSEKSLSLLPGETKTVRLTIQSVGGFDGQVSLGQKGPIQGVQVKIEPSSINVLADGEANVDITIAVQNDAKAGDRNMSFTASTKTLFSEATIKFSIVGTGRVIVEIRNYDYFPRSITVKKGTVITWANLDDVAHTTTSDSSVFDSKDIAGQRSWSKTFDEVGVYPYHCTPHPFMIGTVTVING